MTIGINGNEANQKVRVGVGQYAYELLCHISQISNLKSQIYLSSNPLPDMPKNFEYKIFGPKRLWTLTGLQNRLIQEKMKGRLPDVFFTPSHYTPLFMPTKSVISIMDLAFEKFKEYYKKKDLLQLKYWTQASVMQADKIITISEHTKKDLCALYAVNSDKIEVTYPGYDKARFNNKVTSKSRRTLELVEKYKLQSGYFIFLGTVQPRKNLLRLIEAFSRLGRKNLKLVVVGMIKEGRGGWLYEPVFEKVKELGLSERIVFTGYLPDEDIPYIYAGSLAFVLPSLYEGFGIPPIEAMAARVPVLVSRVSSLPEICGKAALYIENPYDIDSIKKGLEDILHMSAGEMVKRMELGENWVKRYNWNDTAKKTLDILAHV